MAPIDDRVSCVIPHIGEMGISVVDRDQPLTITIRDCLRDLNDQARSSLSYASARSGRVCELGYVVKQLIVILVISHANPHKAQCGIGDPAARAWVGEDYF